jgi:hypothetical protein
MTIKLEVKLDRHLGIQETAFGPVEVDLRQYLVMAQNEFTDFRWVHLGYICEPSDKNPNPPFNGLEQFRVLPQSIKDEIVQRVRELLQLPTIKVHEPLEPVVVAEEDETDDDDVDA